MEKMNIKYGKLINAILIILIIISFICSFEVSMNLNIALSEEEFLYYFELSKINIGILVISFTLNLLLNNYYDINKTNAYLSTTQVEHLGYMKKSNRYKQLYFSYRLMVVISIVSAFFLFYILNYRGSFEDVIQWQAVYYLIYLLISITIYLVLSRKLKIEKKRLIIKEQ